MGQQGSGVLVRDRDLLSARPRAVLLSVIAIFVLVGALTAASGGGSGAATPTAAPAPAQTSVIPPEGLSAAQLKTVVAGTIKHPVFWAGRRRGYVYEFQRSTNGSVYIRYLPPGVGVGDPRSAFVIVATYPYPDALQRLENGATGGIPLSGGGFALVDAAHPTSVHLAFPGIQYEMEVDDPSPTTARRLAASGDIRPVG
jgi:hypothetical protein